MKPLSKLKAILVIKTGTAISITCLLILSSCINSFKTPDNQYGWFDFTIPDLDTTHNSVDMSFLNKGKAGDNGFIRVHDGHFVEGSGEFIRFFGTNFTFESCFPEKETAVILAKKLSMLGYNVVRFHHIDNSSAPRGVWNKEKNALDQSQLEKLDWFIFQLKNNGIYTNLNLHVSRQYPGLDYLENRSFNYGKRIDFFYRPYIEMQKEYARLLLTHRNKYTGNTYADEPAVAFVEINNENSLLSGTSALSGLKGDHRNALIELWNNYLKKKKRSDTEWDFFNILDQFSSGATLQQKEALWEFLFETELSYSEEMTTYLKDILQVKAPISVTQAYFSGMAGVYREAEYADYIDTHHYWQHPEWLSRPWSRTDWLVRNSSMVSDKTGGTLKRFVQHRVKGMPLTISEYDHAAPSFFSAEMYPLLNSVAAFQDWDGIYHFNFNGPYNEGKMASSYFSAPGHPLKMLFIPVGVIMFRMNTIQAGQSPVRLQVPESSVLKELVAFDQKTGIHATHIDYVWQKTGWSDNLTLTRRTELEFTGSELKLTGSVPPKDDIWKSETDQLYWNNRDSLESVFSVNAPAVKAAVGYIGGKTIQLGEVTISMDTTPFNWGVVTLTALDGKPLNESSNVLLVCAGRASNTNMIWNEEKNSVGENWGTSPTRVEGIPVDITLNGSNKFTLFALDAAGNKRNIIKIKNSKDKQLIQVGAQNKTLWYLLTRD